MARLTGSDDLYKLIHALSPEEKGYFKKYAKRHVTKGSRYLELFDAINRQEQFDEKELKRLFKTGYATMKVYLIELILEALVVSESNSPASVDVLKGMVKVHILTKKGLLERALKLIEQYIKIAEDYELYGHVAMLLKSKSNLIRLSLPVQQAVPVIKEYGGQINRALKLQQNADDMLYRQHLMAAVTRVKYYGTLTANEQKGMDIDYLLLPANAHSPLAEKLRLATLNHYYRWADNGTALYQNAKNVMAIEKARWKKLKGDTVTDDYIKAVNNTISAALSATDFKYAEELIEHLVEIRFGSRQMNQENNIRYTHLKQFLLWRTGKHSAGVTFSEQMINRHRIIELFPFQWSKVMMIVMMKALFEFSEKKHKQAIQTLLFFQPALTDKYGIETKKSILFLQLLIQFEIGNYTYIAPMVTSIKNRIEDLSEQEKLFLKNFARHYNNPTTLYNNLLQQCDKVIIRPLLSIKNWAMHKQQKVTLSNIILQHPLE